MQVLTPHQSNALNLLRRILYNLKTGTTLKKFCNGRRQARYYSAINGNDYQNVSYRWSTRKQIVLSIHNRPRLRLITLTLFSFLLLRVSSRANSQHLPKERKTSNIFGGHLEFKGSITWSRVDQSDIFRQ